MSNRTIANDSEDPTYDVFISHAGEDTSWCEQLALRLRDAGIKVWLDIWQMRDAGIDLVDGMEEGLQQSRRAVLVLTSNYMNDEKKWVAAERRYITYKNISGHGDYAIPLLLNDCILPPFLETLKHFDFRNKAAYEVNLQRLVAMLKGAAVDDTAPALSDIPDAIPALGQLPPNSFVPFEWNPHFVGRNEELKQLHILLNGGENTVALNQLGSKASLSGFGGIGKTQLAVEYAFRFGRFYSGGVLWIDAERAEDFQASLAGLAIPMGLNLPSDMTTKHCAARVLAELRRREPRLLILDNLNDSTVLKQCTTAGGGCRILITTRRTDLQRVRQLPIDVLEKESAVQLLFSRRPDLQPPSSSSQHEIGEQICERLAHLPLAIELAAFYLGRHSRLQLSDYLQELEEAGVLDHMTSLGSGYAQSPTDYERNVVESFQLSFREIANLPSPLTLFLAACQFAPYPINPNLLCDVASVDPNSREFEESLNVLLDLSLARSVENGRIQLHRLVKEFGLKIKVNESIADLRESLAERYFETMLQLDTWSLTAISETQIELPHMICAAEMAVENRQWPYDFDLCHNIGLLLYYTAHYSESLKWWKQARQICEAHDPIDEIRLSLSLSSLGDILSDRGQLSEALSSHQKSLSIRNRILGEDHSDVALSLGRIGKVLLNKRDFVGAMNYLQQELKVLKKLHGEDYPDVGWSLIRIGDALRELGDIGHALAHHRKAKAIFEKLLGAEHPCVGWSINHICKDLRLEKNSSDELRYHRKALAIFQKNFGENHPHAAESLNNIGVLLHSQGELAEAAEYLKQSLNIYEKFYDSEYPLAVLVRGNLGKISSKSATLLTI